MSFEERGQGGDGEPQDALGWGDFAEGRASERPPRLGSRFAFPDRRHIVFGE
jgi:hypothetical protein